MYPTRRLDVIIPPIKIQIYFGCEKRLVIDAYQGKLRCKLRNYSDSAKLPVQYCKIQNNHRGLQQRFGAGSRPCDLVLLSTLTLYENATRRTSILKKLVFFSKLSDQEYGRTLLYTRSECRTRHERVASAVRLLENRPGRYTQPPAAVQFAE